MNTLMRVFNAREGFTAKDDTLPKRFFEEIGDPRPTTDKLDPAAWQAAKETYYHNMGWDANGVPTRARLEELGIGWAAEYIADKLSD
jgi:aldehyde:ferredoxin oxidoreductase